MTFFKKLSCVSLVVWYLLASLIDANGASIWDFAPDYSQDPFPPYPSLQNADGSNITIENLRGTRLYGWTDCGVTERNAITEAWNDFHTLASQPSVYQDIDWTDQAATDFWGASRGTNVIPDERRTQILQIYKAAQQMYSNMWLDPVVPPWFWWKYLWLEVRCSGTKGDPDNVCKDRPNDGSCAIPPGRAPNTNTNRNQAVSNNNDGGWPQIIFCNGFFNLYSLSDAINFGKRMSAPNQNNLELWDNRARCFLHEVTHLDYFMNAPDKSPYTWDLTFQYRLGGQKLNADGYGPYNWKVIRNYVRQGKAGFYTQYNADTYAWFAMAKYLQSTINAYPTQPNPGSVSPIAAPRDGNGNPLKNDYDLDEPGLNEDLLGTQAISSNVSTIQGFSIPGCPDRLDTPGIDQAECDENALSGVPYDVFSSDTSNVYSQFCDAVQANPNNSLTWTVDSSGNQQSPTKTRKKKTPPPEPSLYAEYNFELIWNISSTSTNCTLSCKQAYAALADSPCGHQGDQENIMAVSGSLEAGCGTYLYAITGGASVSPD